MRGPATLLAALALTAAGLAACGDDEETTPPSGPEVSISADPDGALAYTETEVTAPAGQLRLVFDNPSSIPHDVVVEDDGGNELARTDVISGDTTEAGLDAEPGDYTYYCSVDAHRQAGMEGTLTVGND